MARGFTDLITPLAVYQQQSINYPLLIATRRFYTIPYGPEAFGYRHWIKSRVPTQCTEHIQITIAAVALFVKDGIASFISL